MGNAKIINFTSNQLEDINSYMPKKEDMQLMADFFSLFSDLTRIRILSLLSMGECCVNDISNILNINQTTVSHQLKMLRANGIVKFRRVGKIIFYSIANTQINNLMNSVVNCVFA